MLFAGSGWSVYNTWVWGVQLRDGDLWAIDMLSGLWKLDPTTLAPLAGGLNVEDHLSTELWVGRRMIWTGTRGLLGRNPYRSGAVLIWDRSGGAPVRTGSFGTGSSRVSDLQATEDDRTLFVSTEAGVTPGIHVFRVDSATGSHQPLAFLRFEEGIHTATLGTVGGRVLLFAAKNPPNPALVIYDVTDLVVH